MNTSKQVNVMLMLMFLVVLAFGLYFVWEEIYREENAAEKQVLKNAERGAFLFTRNCRVCHGVQGLGVLENANLPGLPLNLADNRPMDPQTGLPDKSKLQEIQARFTDTIRCGRVGTLMPPWHTSQGGPLNDFQIEQLVTLISGATSEIIPGDPNAFSEQAWEKIPEFARHDDTIGKFLAQDISASDTVIALNDVSGLARDSLLRIGDVVTGEVIRVKQVPAASELTTAALAGDTVIEVKDASSFQEGMIIAIGKERLRIVSISGNRLDVEPGVEGSKAQYHKPSSLVVEVSNKVVVERGAFATEAAAHANGSEVFAGPIPPPEGPVTGDPGAGTPPCGQLAAAAPAPAGPPAPTPSGGQPQRPATAQPVSGEPEGPSNGTFETETQDNFFAKNNFKVTLGQKVTIRVANSGQAVHNLRIAGLDGNWESADDFVSAPDLLKSGERGELVFSLDREATLVFRCDFHPTQMWGQITVATP